MNQRFVVVGSHPINVKSGWFPPGTPNVVLTESEAYELLRAGAVAIEQDARPAPKRREQKSAGLPDSAEAGVIEEQE